MIRWTLRLAGNLLIFGSALCLLGLGLLVALPDESSTVLPKSGPVSAVLKAPGAIVAHLIPGGPQTDTARQADLTPPAGPAPSLAPASLGHPITHVSMASIALDADVVPARLVPLDGGVTWEVPAFKVGHAESTARAGQPGNAVLLGHVTSVHSGNVFQELDRASVGDVVEVVADDASVFQYRVVSVARVQRSDSSVLEQGDTPAVSLITCTGLWLPTIWDYTERLVVRAELSSPAPAD